MCLCEALSCASRVWSTWGPGGVVQEQKGACGWTKAIRNLVRICDLPVGQNKDLPFEALVSLFQALKMRPRLFYIQHHPTHFHLALSKFLKLPYISYSGGCVYPVYPWKTLPVRQLSGSANEDVGFGIARTPILRPAGSGESKWFDGLERRLKPSGKR